jgi:ABC-2 type transport system ATP-binding protein
VLLIVNGKLAASGEFHAIRAALNNRAYHVRVICSDPRKLAAAAVGLPSVDAVHVDPDGAVLVLSRNVLDVQIELPRLAQAGGISLRRVEPLDDSLESVFGYLVEA